MHCLTKTYVAGSLVLEPGQDNRHPFFARSARTAITYAKHVAPIFHRQRLTNSCRERLTGNTGGTTFNRDATGVYSP